MTLSRTLAHIPYHAWLAVPGVRYAHHDHRFGPCDLPPPDVYRRRFFGVRRGPRCYWDVDWNSIPPMCGCRMCTEHFDRLWERRRDRHRTRVELLAYRGRVDGS